MVTRRKVLVGLQLVVALLLIWGATPALGDSTMPENRVPGAVESTARRLANNFKQDGFEVSRGYFKLYTNDDCPMSYDVLHTCYANNPAAPYVIPLVPSWPNEWVDPALIGAMGPTPKGYGGSFRFAPREAIVILGVLPPHAAYFGLQTYLFTHEGTYDTGSAQYKFVQTYLPDLQSVFFSNVPNNKARIELMASLSNANNNVVIARQSGAVWDQFRYFVITPDKSMDDTVRKTLMSMGVKKEDIFTEPIPGNLALGLEEDKDDFDMVIRYAMPEDGGEAGTPSDRWRHDPPLVVMRIRDARPGAEPQPYPEASLEHRTVMNENVLATDLLHIVAGVKTKWKQDAATSAFLNLQSPLPPPFEPVPFLVGPECTKVGMNCLADTQDTTYQMSTRFALDSDPMPVYAVVGTLSIATGNASYVGLGLNNVTKQLGVGNVSDSQLLGSARKYAPPDVSDPDKFFVAFFARDCTGLDASNGDYCFPITKEMLPECKNLKDPGCQPLGFTLRDYIRPSTQRGPDPGTMDKPSVLPSVVVSLHRP